LTRLSTKLFLANSLCIVALTAIAVWSLLAVERLVRVNQTIAEDSVPAIRLEASLARRMRDLLGYERKFALLDRDPGYLRAWGKLAGEFDDDLRLLGARLSKGEAPIHRVVTTAFLAYVDAFGTDASAEAGAAVSRALERFREKTYATLDRVKTESARLERRTWNAVLFGLCAGVLAALVSSGWLAIRLTRDLRRLSLAAGQIADGTFAGTLPIRRRDEIGEVAVAFQSMAERLKEIDHSKEEFFAHVSHEFRSPLTAVREATSLLRDGLAGPIEPKQERLLGIIASSCERLLRLVDRILSISRLRAKLQNIERRPVGLATVMREAVDGLRPQAEARGLVLEAAAGTKVVVDGDDEQLTQIFVNLVGNAIQHSSEGGRVGVRVLRENGAIEIAVHDAGPGIPPEALAHVFDRYWQAPGAKGGSGLGLAIVKSIVEAHGGTVTGESEPGHGTQFTVRLPPGESK